VNISQERGCLVYFLSLLAVGWPGAQSAWNNHVLACNFAKYLPILFFTGRLSNKPFLIWLLTTPPSHLKYIASLPCNLWLIACYLTLMFHKIVWQHTRIFNNQLIYERIFQWKNWTSVKISQNYGHEFVVSLFLTHPVSTVWYRTKSTRHFAVISLVTRVSRLLFRPISCYWFKHDAHWRHTAPCGLGVVLE